MHIEMSYKILFSALSHLKALVFLYAFEESVNCHLLSSFCDDSNLHISLFKYVLSTMGVSKESISNFLIGNRFLHYIEHDLAVLVLFRDKQICNIIFWKIFIQMFAKWSKH